MKKGFSLIETMFAIVIMMIIIAGIPSVLNLTSNSIQTGYKDKIIYTMNGALNNILLRAFDENNTDINATYKVLGNNDPNTDLQIPRKGKKIINNNFYRKETNDYNLSNIGLDTDENISNTATYDDIDDFNNLTINFENYDYEIKVYYSNDNTNYQDTNITFTIDYNNNTRTHTNLKIIELIGKDITTGKKIVIYYPSYNIGSSKFLNYYEATR